jgi:nicotinate-nucleotide--dimethylbenzimidazole phosphoribosyltransferase
MSLANFTEIRAFLPELPGPGVVDDRAAHTIYSDSRLVWLAEWQARLPPAINHPRIALFAATHGIAGARGIAETKAAVAACLNGESPMNAQAAAADADLRVYEMGLDHPTAVIPQAPAMTEEACAHAMAYGMMAVEPGVDLLCLGSLGSGGAPAVAALAEVLFTATRDPLETLSWLGGYEIAAIAGAILAARLARQPVLLDGPAATAAAAVLFCLNPSLIAHCLPTQAADNPTHALLQSRLGQIPLGYPAAQAITLLRSLTQL